MLAPKDEKKKCNEMSSNPILLVLSMPFEGQLKPPSFLVSKGTKYSKKGEKNSNNSLLAYCFIVFFSFIDCQLSSG